MGEDWASRDELRAVEDSLRKDIRDTERLLRDRDDQKERELRADFIEAVEASEDRQHRRFDSIEHHLDRQDDFIMKKRFTWPNWRRDLSALSLATVISAIAVHFGFGLG